MPLRAIARLIQTMLYAQRFFPYYVYNILGGIEEDGESHPSISRGEMHGTGYPWLRDTSECTEAPASDTPCCLSFVKHGNGHRSVRFLVMAGNARPTSALRSSLTSQITGLASFMRPYSRNVCSFRYWCGLLL